MELVSRGDVVWMNDNMSDAEKLDSTTGVAFDTTDSGVGGRWFWRRDQASGQVSLVAEVEPTAKETADGTAAVVRLHSSLTAEQLEQMIAWLQDARTHIPDSSASSGPADSATASATTEPLLSPAKQERAADYNHSRPYTADLWRAIQEKLGVTVDGKPGHGTALAVAGFQQSHGLPVDGEVGPQTLATLGVGPMRTLDARAFFFPGHLEIDADGAPHAYHPQNKGLDYLGNAGHPGNWWGLAVDASGDPYIQGPDDPAPGYYVSTTALIDRNHPARDPRRYVDSQTVPYVVLPRNINHLTSTPTVRKGDLVLVVRETAPEQPVFAIYADVGPKKELDPSKLFGEGSIALSQALGHDPLVTRNGIQRAASGISSGLFFVVFPGSGSGSPLSPADIEARGRAAFDAWGGQAKLQQALALYRA